MAAAPPTQTRKSDVAITDLKAHVVPEPTSKRAYVVVEVKTDAGLTGVGETGAGTNLGIAVRRILAQKDVVRGQDALAPEALRERLVRSSKATPYEPE